MDLRQEAAGDDAHDRRRGDDRGVLLCQQLAADVALLHHADGRHLSFDETGILNPRRRILLEMQPEFFLAKSACAVGGEHVINGWKSRWTFKNTIIKRLRGERFIPDSKRNTT